MIHTGAWPLLLNTQTSSNFIFKQNGKKKKNFFSLLYAVRDILEMDILKPTRRAQGHFHSVQVKSIT